MVRISEQVSDHLERVLSLVSFMMPIPIFPGTSRACMRLLSLNVAMVCIAMASLIIFRLSFSPVPGPRELSISNKRRLQQTDASASHIDACLSSWDLGMEGDRSQAQHAGKGMATAASFAARRFFNGK